jgi:hypothetical protein
MAPSIAPDAPGAGRGGQRVPTEPPTTVEGLDETLLRDLYATPPPDFVAARNTLVKGLRKDKRRDEATALAALRRPGWDDWALNAVAASDADVVAGFAGAAADVREAQSAAIEGRDGPDIRTAIKELRERSAELVRLAEAALTDAGRQPTAGDINARLSQVATNDVAVAQLLVGILGSGDTAPKDLFGGLEPADRATKATKATSAPRAPAQEAAATKGAAKGAPADDATRDAAAERAARAEQQRRTEALADANREHAAAVKARRRAEADVAKAATAVDAARAALASADEALAAAQSELDRAVATTDEAEAAVNAARLALADA